MGASTKISKEVRQLVTGPSALWAAPETVMGEAVRVRSKMKQRPWNAGGARKARVARRPSLRETPCGLQPSGRRNTEPQDPDARHGAVKFKIHPLGFGFAP